MFKRNILVGLLFLIFSLSGFASEADLAKEAKKYKTLKELCLKSKEWSVLGQSVPFAIKWSSGCEFMRMGEHLQKSEDQYYALSPYVFANMKPENTFFKVDGFTDYSYSLKKGGGHSIHLGNDHLTKNTLSKLYADFNKKYKKIDFTTKKEDRSLDNVKERIKLFRSTFGTSESDYEESLRNARPETATWDTTTYKHNEDKIHISVTTIASSVKTYISTSITYVAK